MGSQKGFLNILNIARENVRENPDLVNADTAEIIARYLKGIKNEADEVSREAKKDNEVYLVDELSDIAWDYAVLLVLLEERGYITSVEEVLAHGLEKYTERAPAFRAGSAALWEDIKTKQKEALVQRHNDKYSS
jgi:phosphoribosyl-ATP pyrophosphohydrolase